MVCLGNICRSPMAEGIMRDKVRQLELPWETDSAGTGDYHVGEAPDKRARSAMQRMGSDISDLRARQFTAGDFDAFDLILAMDASNLANMHRLAPDKERAAKARLIMDFLPEHPLREVPDPYFGGDEGFVEVFEMLDAACDALIEQVRNGG